MKLEYKKRIYWLLRFILIICVINVLTGFYEMCTTRKTQMQTKSYGKARDIIRPRPDITV